MSKRTTFRDVLARVAPKDARTLEGKARLASWLAKACPRQAAKFYKIKSAAISQLFRIKGYAPTVYEAAREPHGDVIISIRYVATGCLQHILPGHLDEDAYDMLPSWATVHSS